MGRSAVDFVGDNNRFVTDEVEQARRWLVDSLRPFSRPPGQQAEIFSAPRSDVIEIVNQLEDSLAWESRVLRAAGIVDDDLESRIADICEQASTLGRADEVPGVEVLESEGWKRLRAVTSDVIIRLSNPQEP